MSRSAKTYDAQHLTTEQLAGVACVECGGELILTTASEVGVSPGYGAVYACADGCGRVMPIRGHRR